MGKYLDSFRAWAIRHLEGGNWRPNLQRDTQAFARAQTIGQAMGTARKDKPMWKPTPTNLRYFSRTPYARRAINQIKNPIGMLPWEVRVKKEFKENAELKRQCQLVTDCLRKPNLTDSARTLFEQIIEDYLVVSAGAAEIGINPNNPLRPLWLWPVDGQSIQIYAFWDGRPSTARYLQTIGYGAVGLNQGVQLRNDQLLYMRPNPSSATPYGYGPLEIAFNSISRQLGAGEYAGNVAANGQPGNLIYAGDMDKATIETFKQIWRNEVEGQGVTPIIGGPIKPDAIKLHAATDEALYLKYQEFLKTEIAVAFDLSPQNLGVERDVNRNTAEVGEDRDWAAAIIPHAKLLESHLNADVIEGGLGYSQIEFHFIGLDREDELNEATIFEKRYKNNSITPNEFRIKRGEPPMESQWGDMTFADTQIEQQQARAGTFEDPDAQGNQKPAADPAPANKQQSKSKSKEK